MKKFKDYSIAVLIVVSALALAGCGGGSGAPTSGSSGTSTDLAMESILPVTASVTQSVTNAPAPAPGFGTTPAVPVNNGWDNANSLKIPGLTLIQQLNSSGSNAWDYVAHPLIYVATAGGGYGGLISTEWIPSTRTYSPTVVNPTAQVAQGVLLIDAATKQVITSTAYLDIGASAGANPITAYGEPHGMGASMDGQWFYSEGTDSRSTSTNHDVALVINAHTLKVDKILNTRLHHASAYYDAASGKNLVLIDAWGYFYALDPSNNNTVQNALAPSDLDAPGYLGAVDNSGQYLFITCRGGIATESGVVIVSLATWKVVARINTDDIGPTMVAFSVNGDFAYVSGYHDSSVSRINMKSGLSNVAGWTYDARSGAGTEGDYGLALNWNDTMLFAVGKQEGSSNKGEELGLVPTAGFGSPITRSNGSVLGPLYLGGCIRPDHAIVNPNTAANELWISCNSSFETMVVQMGNNTTQSTWSTPQDWKSFKVINDIPSPNYASTHNGAFVQYNSDGTGALLSDLNGLHGSAFTTKQTLDKGPTS